MTPGYLALMLCMAIIIGILAGSYPAFYLSSFKPLEVLSGRIRAGSRSGDIRKRLVIFQFTLSMGLIICTLLIYKQLIHLQSQDLGFDKENILVISNTDELGNRKAAFKNHLENLAGVKSSSFSTMVPPDVVWSDIFQPVGKDENDRGFSYFFTDESLVETMDLEMISGRFFSKDFSSDSNAVVINEIAAGLMGWDNAVGEKIRTHWKNDGSDIREVIGVIKDFNFQSLKEEITSLVIFYGNQGNLLLVKLSPGDVKSQVEIVQSEWASFVPGIPFEYSFVDERFDAAFRQEQRLGKIFMIFSGLAILVACLGLFGLASFTSEQRAKEIGIRKSMGSSSIGIVKLLTKEYLKLVIISFVLASPLALYIMSQWLTRFAYKTDIGFLVFVIGGFIGLLIALLSVSYQCIQAANKNPVDSLKCE
jgi:putative ABC transport system permease protein